MINERRGVAAFIAIILAMSLVSAPVNAGPRYAQAQTEQAADVRISRDQAAAAARKATGGLVLKVKLEGKNKAIYRVRVLLEGERVRTVRVDARTGRVLD